MYLYSLLISLDQDINHLDYQYLKDIIVSINIYSIHQQLKTSKYHTGCYSQHFSEKILLSQANLDIVKSYTPI